MSDVRINGKRFPALQAIDLLGQLITRLEALGGANASVVTSVHVNGRIVDIDNNDMLRMRLDSDDTVEVRLETLAQMAFECVQVAQEMAELLVFDLKVVTLHLWEGSRHQDKSLETLINDCHKFLLLGARPLDLLDANPYTLPEAAQQCLRQLDNVAANVEDATLLAVSGEKKDACHVLVARVKPAIERWLGLSAVFAEHLEIDRAVVPTFGESKGNIASPQPTSR
jgi:hypothetical protein